MIQLTIDLPETIFSIFKQSSKEFSSEMKLTALAYALNNPNHSAIIDNKPARNCAKFFDLKTFGTLSIIIKAKQRF